MPRPLNDQVVVITGASTGIGRETALKFAACGARLVLAARNGEALEALAADIRAMGTRAVAVPTDVQRREEVERLAETAMAHFGRIDTWVNNAAVSLYGTIIDTPVAEMRTVVDTVFWGSVYGIQAALPRMKKSGGVIVNVGSIVSDIPVPLQGAYVAAKHAVKGFSHVLNMELKHDGIPVSVVLLKLPSVDTPFFEHARSRTGRAPRPVWPVYDPAVIARAIVRQAVRPSAREVAVGGGAKWLSAIHRWAPGLVEAHVAKAGFAAQQTDTPKAVGEDSLFRPAHEPGSARGAAGGWRVSWVQWLGDHKAGAAAGLALTGAALAAVARRR